MMNEKDLQELKEMTGLVSESELNNAKREAAPEPCKPMYDRQAKAAISRKELAAYVGRFVKVGKTYGLIDDVHTGGRLGFVHCEGDTWTASLVNVDDVVILTDSEDIRIAKDSALAYFANEQASLEHRIQCSFKFDDQMKLSHMLWKVNKWLKWLDKL